VTTTGCSSRAASTGRRLSALGHRTVPVQIGAKLPVVVDRDDADDWPNVVAGIYTPDQARAVFDRMFEGRQPAGLRGPGAPGE
jgi:hypothetical protein